MIFFYKISKQRFIYRFQLISITLSTNITNTDGEILIIYKGLKDARKFDTNGEEDNPRYNTYRKHLKLRTVVCNI